MRGLTNEARIGHMRHRVSLMREEQHCGAGGRLVQTTPIIAEVWASITDRSSDRVDRADQQKKNSLLTVNTHYCETLMAADRARINGTMYRITSKQKHGLLNPLLEMQMRSCNDAEGKGL